MPYITPKQQQILKLIYKFRFLNRLQIQRFLNHKNHKRILDWLNDLIEKEYIEKVPKLNTFEERTKLTVFRIGANGIRFLKPQEDCYPEIIQKLYRDNNRSDNFINHCILLADIYLELQSKNKNIAKISDTVTINSEFVNPDSPFNFLTDLNPNLVYEERGTQRKSNKYCLLEVFEKTLPRYSMRKRLRDYIDFYYSFEGEDNLDSEFPDIKLVCNTKADLIYLKRYARTLFEDDKPEDLKIHFSKVDDIFKYGLTGDVWEE